MAADLSALRSDALEERPDQYRGVSMHLDLEMTKKELEKKILELEARVNELQSQLLTLALQKPTTFVTVPAPAPAVQPLIIGPSYPPYLPYIGDWPISPNITCSATNTQRATQQQQQNFS